MLFFCSLRNMLKITSFKKSQTETNMKVSQASRGNRGKREAAQRDQTLIKSKDTYQADEPAEVRTTNADRQTEGTHSTRAQPGNAALEGNQKGEWRK